jgi:hypothetical protein
MLDAPGTKKTGFLEEMTSLTPQSRAQIGANMFYENIGALLNRFDDPHEAGKYLKALSNSDMETWKELGSRFAESPEFYTVLPALKDYNAQGLDGIIQAWDTSQPNRDALLRISDVLGTEPAKLLDDLAAKGTADQDFQRIAQRLGQSEAPEAQALLAEIQAGTLTPDSLKQMVDAFTGDGAMPWHPGQAKAMMLDSLGSHFDEWVSTRLMLDQTPEAKSAFFRTAALMKQAQSILLLGASPGYAITNGLSNMVHRAASGLFGYLTPNQINGWMDRFGVSPARFDEGVGIGGMIDQATQKTGVKTEAQQAAVRGTGHLADAKDKLAKLSRGMPFSKLSSWFEKSEGRQAFSIAMRQFWSQSWRRGVGFQKMDTGLTRSLQSLGVDPGIIYSAIEAGMNQKEIENILSGRFEGIQTRSLINDAAQRTGITAQQAADLLEKTGVLDALDSQLKGKTTRDGVSSAFRRADKIAQDYMDMRAGEDLKAIAEHARQKAGIEGAVSGLDVVQRVNGTYFDAWLDHYFRLGEVMEDLSTLDDPALRSKAIELQYQQSDAEFRRINARTAANYQGIFEAWGQSDNPRAMEILAAVSQSDQAMKAAYDFMRAERKAFFQEGRPIEEWNASQALIDTQFEVAFKHKHNAEVKMGESLGTLYDELYGPAAGEAARKWWKDVTAFNDDIVKREKKARSEFAQLPKQQREAAKQKYYREAKIMLIAEAEKINQEGVTRLERIIKKGGGRGQGGTPLPKAPDDPTRPGGPADEVDAMLAEAETRKAEEARAKTERKAAVWDVAEEFARVGLPFNREIFQDQGSLVAALRNEEHGGFPDLQRLDDERLNPENVRSILEKRAAVKAAEDAKQVDFATARAEVAREEAAKKTARSKAPKDITLLQAIKANGGIDISIKDMRRDITGSKTAKGWQPGIFSKTGKKRWPLDTMARILANEWDFPIRLDDPGDPGGVNQLIDLMQRAQRGETIYPTTHDFEAEIKAAETAYAEAMQEQTAFDQATWQRELDQAIEAGDLTAMYEKIGELPEALEGKAPTGESWSDYLSRMADETALRVTQRNIDEAIADQRARIEADTQAGVSRGDKAMTKRLLEEKFRDVFGLTDEQANAYMELSEAIAGWYTRATGESGDGFYSRYYEDVVSTDGGDLLQEGRIEPINRRMTQPETENYARALVRAGADELRRAVQGEKERGDRIALLNEAHKLNPAIAESVAKESISILFQNAYHGTPYKFDKFTLDAIGTGEGAQVFGWGLYFAGERKVAEYYRQGISKNKLEFGSEEQKLYDYWEKVDQKQKAIDDLQKQSDGSRQFQTRLKVAGFEYRQALEAAQGFGERPPELGQVYKVDIPDDNYFLWNKTLGEQPQAIRDAFKSLGKDEEFWHVRGSVLYKYLEIDNGGSAKAASLAMKEVGINGIKYLDENSRTQTFEVVLSTDKGEYSRSKFDTRRQADAYVKEKQADGFTAAVNETGTHNYVIFDDNAIQIKETYYQATEGTIAKGAVEFGPDNIKATIHAFEAADMTTLVHENAHVFRRVLADVASRTDSKRIKADLTTIEEWAGVKDGQWNRDAEEKFARGFEQYLAEGKAPTPKLKRAFESFKNWMLSVYKQITGSDIDAKITDEVRQVFDRMLAENPEPDILYQRKAKVDPNQMGMFGAEDLPLFSGTPQSARAETFAPQQATRQETMFDMRPQMKGAETKIPTETPEFKRWFGDSKIVDDDGRPMVVYHSTGSDFTSFREGQHFGTQRQSNQIITGKTQVTEARQRLGMEPESPTEYRTIPVYLKIENPLRVEDFGGNPEAWDQAIAEAKAKGYDGLVYQNWGEFDVNKKGEPADSYVAFNPEQIKSTANRGTYSPTDPNILFQEATQPTGSLDAASQFNPQSEAMDQGHTQFIRPLLAAMEETAINQLDTKPMESIQGADDATQAQLRRYVKQVQNDMATSKLATVRYGEQQRDFAMLNYGKTYGFDRAFQVVSPYELYYTRSMFTWAARALDKPALFSNYARLKMQQQRYERDIPERLRGKIKIPAPFLPDWMGDGLYIDPLGQLFFPAQFLKPFERLEQDKTQQELEAERILQEWAADGSITGADIQQAQNKQGPAYERAIAEAQIRRESEIANPMDFFSTMFGPAWYLSAPLNAAGIKVPGISKGDPNKISTLPITNTARAIDTVTAGSWAEPIGDLIGLIGKPEEWIRKKAGLPALGEYGEYYQKRQVANMVAEGLITSEDAQIAMIEKQGEIWEQAGERVKMELAVRVPGAAALYAGLHEGPKGLAQAALPSLFGAGLLPAGELEYRGLKSEWNEAWKKADAGDKEAINAFFDEHPEYQAYLAKGKDDGELMKSFMIGQIWDGYMQLGATNQKQARKEMGELFSQAFLDKETRSYESIDTDTLIQWAQMLNKRTPQAVNTQPLNTPPAPELNLYNEDVTAVTDEYFRQRKEDHGNYYSLEQGYYSLPKSQRGSFLLANPELKEYWDFKKTWEKTYPDLVPIFKGQVFKQVNTDNWPPGLLDYVTTYAYTGAPLKKGAYKALEQQWIMEGRPMDDLKTWLNSQVVPALMYSGQ